MSTVTDNDLKELKDLIISQNQKINKIVEDNTNIQINLAKLEGKVDTVNARLDAYKPALDKIPDLAEKMGELKVWRAVSLVVFSGFVTSLFWLFKTANF